MTVLKLIPNLASEATDCHPHSHNSSTHIFKRLSDTAQCSGFCITTHGMRTLDLLRSLLEHGTTPREDLGILSNNM